MKKCAVVGSSAILLQKEYGGLIDTHDVVIRFGQATTDGYEKHVGMKTDVRVLNGHNFSCLLPEGDPQRNISTKNNHSKFSDTFVLELQNQYIIIKDFPSVADPRFAKIFETMRANGCEVVSYNPDSKQLVEELTGITDISCGLLGIIFASLQGYSISCFGFSFYLETRGSNHYYEEAFPLNEGDDGWNPPSHNWEKEKNLIEFLDAVNFINLYR